MRGHVLDLLSLRAIVSTRHCFHALLCPCVAVLMMTPNTIMNARFVDVHDISSMCVNERARGLARLLCQNAPASFAGVRIRFSPWSFIFRLLYGIWVFSDNSGFLPCFVLNWFQPVKYMKKRDFDFCQNY